MISIKYNPIRSMKWLLIISVSVVIISCGKGDDEQVVFHMDLPSFQEINLQDVFDVEFLEADSFTLAISGRKDIVEKIVFDVDQNILTLRNEYGKSWFAPEDNKIKLLITGKGLTKINAEETCNIQTLNTITSETFILTLGGKLNIARLRVDCGLFYYYNTSPVGGLLHVTGRADEVGIFNGSLMAVDARDLICTKATVETSSKTDIYVHVLEQLHYSITGVGNIYLYGDPNEITAGALFSTGRLIPQ